VDIPGVGVFAAWEKPAFYGPVEGKDYYQQIYDEKMPVFSIEPENLPSGRSLATKRK
jgi:hypothetical protein